MKNRKTNVATDAEFFWSTSKEYISHQLPDIQKVSPNTAAAYRDGINLFIDYLEENKQIRRAELTFDAFSRNNLKDFLDWMIHTKKYAEKTCNLRITAIHSLLEYAGYEHSTDLMGVYLSACSVKCLKVKDKPIEYFDSEQMKALLSTPRVECKTDHRNRMMLILYYDTGARNSELLEATCNQLHLDVSVPYITILGKGRKYRNVPLMDKTVAHLKQYMKEFHEDSNHDEALFYTTTYGKKHRLSNDTVECMIKRYSRICESQGISMPHKPICHMIRKTRAMDLYNEGMPLAHIQQLLGHENMSTTTGFYAFVTLDTLAKSLEKANSKGTGNKKWSNEDVLKKIYRL